MISRYKMIMRCADMAMWLACAAVATWLAGTQIVLVSTYLTEFYQTKPRKQSGALPARLLFYPQCRNRTCRHYENRVAEMCAHLCRSVRARLHCTPGYSENYLRTWGGTQSESAVQMGCARGVCSWAGRAREVGQMHANSHAGRGGCKHEVMKHCTWVV